MRAKVCNLIGNLCRLSDGFYEHMLQLGLLPLLVQRCADPDPSARKFACFAVGNAGFHSGSLYGHLAPCVPLLVSNLADADPKTRANAAGALGNLARNGPRLCDALNAASAAAALLEVVRAPLVASPDATSDLSPSRTALFSLGNLAAHARCADAIRELALGPTLEALAALGDETLHKYAERVLGKLAAHPLHEGGGKHTPLPVRRTAHERVVQG